MTNRTWWKECTVYQIYPRSFCDSNGDGIGDIRGIIRKLDYLKYLGIDVIWLCPIYQSPNDDNGYDISDYQNIMKEFGTMEDFELLLKSAHQRGLKIVIDMVLNHTSDEHKWFLESRKSRNNYYRNYYIWREEKESVPNNWGSFFGGPAWEYSDETKMYYLHLFSKKQPDLNWDNENVRKSVKEILKWWLDKGVDGFRLDTINLISKEPEMPDGEIPPGETYGCHTPYTTNGPNVHSYIQELTKEVFSHYDIMTVGETLDTTPEDALRFANLDGSELNMIFTFEHMQTENVNGSKWTDQRFKLTEIKKVLSKWQTVLDGKAWNSLYWNNHDQPRVVSRFGDDKKYWNKSAKMLAVCLHMLQGTPYIYQGEEIGMTNIYYRTIDEYCDIESKAAYHQLTHELGKSDEDAMKGIRYRSRDNARSPMQWDDTENAGFTTGTPWFAVNENYKLINVKNQMEDEDSILNFYRRLIALRKKIPVIAYGKYILLDAENENIYAYSRSLNEEKLLIVCNFTAEQQVFELKHYNEDGDHETLIGNYVNPKIIQLGEKLKLRPYEALVLRKLS